MPQALDYLPLRFRSSRQGWVFGAILATTFAVAAGIVVINLGLWHPASVALFIAAISSGCLGAGLWAFDVVSECRIEGGMLSLRSYTDRRPTQFDIASIYQMVDVRLDEAGWHELVFYGGKHLRLMAGAFSQLTDRERHALKTAMLAVNPDLQFLTRDGLICPACGKKMVPLKFPESRCSECGELKPQQEKMR